MTVHNRIAVAFVYDNTVQVRNIFYYRTSFTTLTGSQAGAIVDLLYDSSGLCAQLSNKLVETGVYTSHWTGPADGIWWQETEPHRKPEPPWSLQQFTTHTNASGTILTEDLGPVPAALVTAYTLAKRVRGHKYFSGIPEGLQSSGIINGALLTALQTFVGSYQAPISVGSDQAVPELWGYRWGFNEITGAVVREAFSTQRRRAYGRGV